MILLSIYDFHTLIHLKLRYLRNSAERNKAVIYFNDIINEHCQKFVSGNSGWICRWLVGCEKRLDIHGVGPQKQGVLKIMLLFH